MPKSLLEVGTAFARIAGYGGAICKAMAQRLALWPQARYSADLQLAAITDKTGANIRVRPSVRT